MPNESIKLPLTIPEGSVILCASPLKWREPNGAECELTGFYWEPDGWHVEVTCVVVDATCSVTVGIAEPN
jgi:hypothetical protein